MYLRSRIWIEPENLDLNWILSCERRVCVGVQFEDVESVTGKNLGGNGPDPVETY